MSADEPSTPWHAEERLRTEPATRDHDHPEQFTDEEAAFLRQVRFGRLPDPVPPEDWVAEQPADTRYEPPELPFDPRTAAVPGA